MANQEKSDTNNNQESSNSKEAAKDRMAESRHEKPVQNQNFDQAQRRNQAGPRGYGDSTGIKKGERENGMERMEEKDPEDQTDLNKKNKE